MYITQCIFTHLSGKRQFILMKGMSWKLLFPLQEITVCLALEVDAFAVKEPVAGQPKAENKHFFQMFGCLFWEFFSKKQDQKEVVQYLVTFLTNGFHAYVFVPIVACFHTKPFL